ncbi:hypothetical protein DSM112329_01677 [Paraconexibacter sp. AEG42_29]|uniref:CHAD domain-containing protein n=1 Tax=Paraconexibacter sp. AEG42_29 TaxID=2997339 RepID=A0AAU7AU17_9ACTN
MKAARVKGLKPQDGLADSIQRIVATRLGELCAFMPVAEDPERVTELHDMRIAAKRLRYVLEISADLFGPYAAPAVLRTKELQSVLGDIHDCDVTLPLVVELIERARADDVAAVVAAQLSAAAIDLDPSAVADAAPHASAHRGLASMAVYLQARREVLFARFLELWLELEREGFRARLLFAIGERPIAPIEPATPVAPAPVAPPSEPDPEADPVLDGVLSHDSNMDGPATPLPSNEV